MRYWDIKKSNQTASTFSVEKEISKGTLGCVMKYPNETVFTFFNSKIGKRKKLKEEMKALINSYKEHQINEGILKIKSINTNYTSATIITEPVIDSISNLHSIKFKCFEIYKMFQKFNAFIKYCSDKKINLSNLKLSDIYLTKNHEIKLLSIIFDIEILHKIKKEKFSDIHNDNTKNNMLYVIGTIMYYLYYNEYPKKNETKFPEQKHFKELLKYCLNLNTKFDFNNYISQSFFHPDIIFPNNSKENIKLFSKYVEYKPSIRGYLSPDCEELYCVLRKKNEIHYSIYNSFDKSKFIEIESYGEPGIFKLKTEKNKNIYLLIFDHLDFQGFILKKNINNTFTIIQEIKNFYSFLELSNGDLAFSIRGGNFNIYTKNSDHKFDIKFTISDVYARRLFETDENYLSVNDSEKSLLYDIINFKLIKENKNGGIYLNEKIIILENGVLGSAIYHEYFEEEILDIDDKIISVMKKMDGTYLLGGYKNHIYQIYFDKYGFAEIISEVDSGYGYYEDDLSGQCIYSIPDSRYYSVGYIVECKNGDIITISELDKIKKFWKY